MLYQGTLLSTFISMSHLNGQTRFLQDLYWTRMERPLNMPRSQLFQATQDYTYTNAYGYFSIEFDNVVDSISVRL